MVISVLEKLILFGYRYGKSHKVVAQELEISAVYLSMILNAKRPLSDRLTVSIELLFKRYECVDFLDKKGRL